MTNPLLELPENNSITNLPSTHHLLDNSYLLKVFSKSQQQQLRAHLNLNQTIQTLEQHNDFGIIVDLLRQSQQYRPTWYFPTGMNKLLTIRRCCLSSRNDLFHLLFKPEQVDTTLFKIKQRFLKTFHFLCHSEIFKRKLDYESRDTSSLKPYRTRMGTLFTQHFFRDVLNIEQQAKNCWVNQRTQRLRQRAFTY